MSLNEQKRFNAYSLVSAVREDTVILAHDPVLGDVNIQKSDFLAEAVTIANQALGLYLASALYNGFATDTNVIAALTALSQSIAQYGGTVRDSHQLAGQEGQALINRIAAVEGGQSAALLGYATQALLYANLAPADKSVAYVTNDPTPGNNGTYRKSGASETGSWVQSSFDRVAAVETRTSLLETGPTPSAFAKTGLSFQTQRITAGVKVVDRTVESTFSGWASAIVYAGQSFDVVGVNLTIEDPAVLVSLKVRSIANFNTVICESCRQISTSGTHLFVLPRKLVAADITGGAFWLSAESKLGNSRIAIPQITKTAANASTTTYPEQYIQTGATVWHNVDTPGNWSFLANFYDTQVDADTLASVAPRLTTAESAIAAINTGVGIVSRMGTAETGISTLNNVTVPIVNRNTTRLSRAAAPTPLTAALSSSYTTAATTGSFSGSFVGWAGSMNFVAPFDRVSITLMTENANVDVIVEIRDSNFTTVLATATIRTGAIGTALYYATFDRIIDNSLLTGGVYYLSYKEATGTKRVFHPWKSAFSADKANRTTYPPKYTQNSTTWSNADLSTIYWEPLFTVYNTTDLVSDFVYPKKTDLDLVQTSVNNANSALTVVRKNGRTAPIVTESRITQTASSKFTANSAYSVYSWNVQQNIATDKIINTISIPIVKDWFNGTSFTQPILVRIAKNGVFFYSYTIQLSELAAYNALTTGSQDTSFDYYMEFPDMEFLPGDTLFVGWDCGNANKMTMLYGSIVGGVEGAEGLSAYSTTVSGPLAAMTNAPAIATSYGFTLRVRSYYRRYIAEVPLAGSATLTTLVPKKVYTVLNDASGLLFNSRRTAIPVFLDRFVQGLVSEPDIYFQESGKDMVVLYSSENLDDGTTITPGATTTTTKTLHIKSATTYNTVTVAVEQKSTLESVGKTLFPKILTIGDSVTDGFLSGLNVPAGGPWQYWANIKEEFERARIDNGDNAAWHNCLMVGHKSIRSWNLTYGTATNRALKACAEGFGGWSLSDQLMNSRSWSGKYCQGYWDLAGLGNGTGTDYVNSSGNNQIICTTPEGKFAPTNTAAFIAYINAQLTGSAVTYADAVALLSAKQNNPENPFYDKTVAAAGDHAFSMATYLSRYKTLSNDGVTRLVVGSTAGSQVTVATAYDVCVPTHIILQHSLNDGDVSWLGTIYRTLTNAIKAEYVANGWGAVCIGLSVTDHTGTYFPSRYPDFDPDVALWNSSQAGGHTQQYNNMNRLYTTFWVNSANEDTEKIFLLPSFHVMPTAWSTPYRELPLPSHVFDGRNDTMYKKMWSAGPDWHPNGIAHRTLGLSMYAWVKYTLNL